MRADSSPRTPRALHPGAWWLWALGLAVAASRTYNPVLLLLIGAVAGFVVAARRTDAPWARAYAVFFKVALMVIVIRVLFQSVLTTYAQGTHVMLTLPQVPLPEWIRGIKLGGVVTWEAFASALYEGGQLGVMLLCIGAANALASPLRLLRCMPGALYEMQVACVVALTFVPQLVTDARRVYRARRLRGQRVRVRSIFRTTMMPVLEGALDRSVELAAAMDARGFGRTKHLSSSMRWTTSGVSLGGLVGLLIGLYGLLSASMPTALAVTLFLLSLVLLVGSLVLGRQRAIRSRYRPDPWALPEWLVAASGAVSAAVFVGAAMGAMPGLKLAGPLATPPLNPVLMASVLVAILPAFVAPLAPAVRRLEPAPHAEPRVKAVSS